MKILHIITRLDRGGSAEVVLELAKGHKKIGHEVLIAVGITREPQADLDDFSEKNGIPIFHIQALKREINPFNDIAALFEILKVIKTIRPDVVHAHTSKAGFIGRLAGRLAGVRAVVYTPHGHVFYGYYGGTISRVFIFLEKLAAAFSNRITTLTEIEKRDFIKEGIAPDRKIVTIPCGIIMDRFLLSQDKSLRQELNIPPYIPVVGWAGRLEHIKGCEYFLKTCQLIKEEIPGARFLIAGDGPLRKEMEDIAYSLGLDGNLSFLGFRNDMPEVMNTLDLLVHTPLNEGLGRVLIEAMVCGKPIVASNVGGVPEIVDDGITGFLVPSGDFASMARESLRILLDKELAGRLGKAGRNKAGDYSMERMVEKTCALYSEIARAGKQ